MKDWTKRLFSTVLAATLLVSNILPAFAFAAESEDTGLCKHHSTHTDCGYVVTGEDQKCNFVCEACAEENASAVAVAEVKALIDAMPSLDAIQSKAREEQSDDYNQVQYAYDAYEKLTEDQKAQLPDSAEVFGSYFEYFNNQIAEDNVDEIANGTCGKNLTWVLNHDGILTISGTGEMDNFVVEEDSGIYYPGKSPWDDYKDQIQTVIIEEGVTTIGHCAFSLNPVLEDVSIPEGITSIGEWAFDDCVNLKTIALPDSLKTIEQFAFSGTGLTEINIPDSVTKIGGSSFLKCSDLANVELSNNITEIPRGAFAHCAFTHFEIPSSVAVIGSDAFYNCTALTSIVIPESVTTIMDFAFSDCIGIKSITFEGNAPEFSHDDIEVQSSAFENVVATAYYPGNNSTWTEKLMQNYGGNITWVAIEDEHFHVYGDNHKCDCGAIGGICGENLTWLYDDKTKTLTISGSGKMYDGWSFGDYTEMKTIIVNEGVTSIGAHAFAGKKTGFSTTRCSVNTVALPSTLLEIREYAFADCIKLNKVVIPNSVSSIGASAFSNCQKLADIEIPAGVKVLETNLFSDCYQLNNVSLPDSIVSIKAGAFYRCKNLYNIDLPNKLESIGDAAFDSCPFSEIDIPDSVIQIDSAAFIRCANLRYVKLPPKLTTISSMMFYKCSSLKAVAFPEDVASIGNLAFAECGSLIRIDIPATVTSIGGGAFSECDSLSRIVIPASADTIEPPSNTGLYGGVFRALPLIKTVGPIESDRDLQYGWSTCIPAYSFYSTSITSAIIASGITKIEQYSFAHSTIEYIVIPKSVTQIEKSAFLSCGFLRDVYYEGSEEEWNAISIEKNNTALTDATIHFECISFKEHTESSHDTLAELTELDYLAFSWLAYLDFETNGTVEDLLIEMGYWEDKYFDKDRNITYADLCKHIAKWHVDYSLISDKSHTNGFYAVPFESRTGGEIVLAYRGSVPLFTKESILNLDDTVYDWLINDLPIELLNKLGPQYESASSIYSTIVNEMDKYYEEWDKTNIVVTGHSLGGAWADVVSAFSGCKGVTFNAVSVLDTVYNAEPVAMGRLFSGVDTWNFIDHVNKYDGLAGSFEKYWSLNEIKPYVGHDTIYSDFILSAKNHSLKSIVEEHGDYLCLTTSDITSSYTPFNPVYNYLTFKLSSIDLGTSRSDIINEEANSNGARKIFGGAGSDDLTGGILSDTLVGGHGYDDLDGSWLNDTYIYYKGDNWDTIYDVSGSDKLYLYDFEASDSIEAVVSADENTIDILCNGSKIVSIYRNNREYSLASVNQFVIHVGSKEYDITSMFNSMKYSARIKIACPVDIQVIDKNGNIMFTLNDSETGNFYTDYGNFYVYEEVNGGYGKVLDLVEGYTVRIVGVDTGTMDISYHSVEKGELSEAKTLSAIPVTSSYKAILTVDESGEIRLVPSDDDTHTSHIAGTDWFYDDTNHWHKCTGCENTVDLAAHIGGTATCMAKAVCTVCNQTYGVKDAENHTGKTTVTGKKESTCGTDGYTGDTVCECGETLAKGEVIPATGKHAGGTATCSEEAVCKVCGQSYGKTDPKNHRFTEYKSDHNATCKKNGTKTAKCDYGCGKTDTVTDRGSKLGHKFDGDKCIRCGQSRWNPDTGDKIMIAVAVLIISGAALLVLLTRKKRK